MPTKSELLSQPIDHYDIKAYDVVPQIDAMRKMAFSSRDLARASEIFDRMLADTDCAVILTMAGSLISAGLKNVFVDMIRNNMVDAVVTTGANIIDQDFFEALGYKHYVAPDKYKSGEYDKELMDLMIDRIYDTLIDEEQLRECDDLCGDIADGLEARPYSSREFIKEMGRWLENNGGPKSDSILWECYKRDVPIFAPAFSDCSAGFGLIQHQHRRMKTGEAMVSIDSVRDFYELATIKMKHPTTGLFMCGGGVPKNFAQDITVAADIFGHDASLHKYAIQVTVADVRDGALSSSTLKEAASWGKVDTVWEQMVFSEATLAVPLIAGYGYHKGSWKNRKPLAFAQMLGQTPVLA
ncbi:MAG: deoxyhypusine synthase [Phycisphaerae bacterium]